MEGDIKETPKTSMKSFQSTPSAWRETYVSSDAFAASHISIHSLRMEGDRPHPRWTQFRSHFNPLPPHGGRPEVREKPRTQKYFNPLPPHGGRQQAATAAGESITFQSTPSAWRETSTRLTIYVMSDFNPLPPHGGRPAGSGGITMTITFQSTPSAWRETGQDHGTRLCRSISIHSLRMEGDYIDLGYLCGGVYFNPLPPHGGRHIDLVDGDPAIIISIHSLRMEGDLPCQNLLSAWGHFNPLPPHGGRPCTPSWT